VNATDRAVYYVDPTPLGEKRDHQSLLPLITDLMIPPGPPPNLRTETIESLPLDLFQVARLESGTKLDGVSSVAFKTK